jgi:O-antigen ligase
MIKSSRKLLKINTENTIMKADAIAADLPGYPKLIYFLFYLFSAYLVVPIVDIPILGLSLSAPVVFIIAVACFLKPPSRWFKEYNKWILLAMFFWTGVFLSTVMNGILSGGIEIGREGLLTLVRYVYWLSVFVVGAYFTSQKKVLNQTAQVLGYAVLALAVLRLGEAVILGNIGSGYPDLLTQNSYGLMFSTFSPYLLIWIIQKRRGKLLFSALGYLLLIGAVAINGSRGSWVSIAGGLGVCLIMLFISKPRKLMGLLMATLIISILFIVVWNTIPQVTSSLQSRLSTFQSLEEDKSYTIRELMVQKGIRLFKASPLFGVGASRFTQTSSELDIPGVLGRLNPTRYDRKSAHNSYVVVLAEYGLAGAIPYAFLLITLVIKGFFTTIYFVRKNDFIHLAVFLSLVQMSIHFWAIASLTNTAAWFVYGLSAASIMLREKDRDKCV